jgi:hypothetical protein
MVLALGQERENRAEADRRSGVLLVSTWVTEKPAVLGSVHRVPKQLRGRSLTGECELSQNLPDWSLKKSIPTEIWTVLVPQEIEVSVAAVILSDICSTRTL